MLFQYPAVSDPTPGTDSDHTLDAWILPFRRVVQLVPVEHHELSAGENFTFDTTPETPF